MGSVTVLKVKRRHCFFEVERFARLDHPVNEVGEFAHHGTNHRFWRKARRAEAVAKYLERRVVASCHQARHIKRMPQRLVPGAAHHCKSMGVRSFIIIPNATTRSCFAADTGSDLAK